MVFILTEILTYEQKIERPKGGLESDGGLNLIDQLNRPEVNPKSQKNKL